MNGRGCLELVAIDGMLFRFWFICFSRGQGGGVFSTVESLKGLARPKQARDLA